MRVDLYGAVHKAQRYHLFQFAGKAGKADLADDIQRATLATEVRDIVRMLRDHARNEEHYIHPLFERLGTAARLLHEEHDALETSLGELLAIIETGRMQELYRVFARFLAEYLLHIDTEERVQAQVLWPALSDAELGEVLQRFKAERDPAEAAEDLRRFLPALSAPELAQMFRGIRASAPASVFQEATAQGRSALGPAGWAAVEKLLM